MESEKIDQLRSLGFNLFPLKPNSKEPILGTWKQYQTEKYEGVFPDSCNVAVVCGSISNNLFVIDLDDASIFDDIPDELKNTRIVKTGKGYHLYYHYNGLPPANKKLDDHRFRHIDIKSEGGYVLSEGSYYVPTTKEKADHKYPKENENGFYYTLFKDLPIMTLEISKLKEILNSLGFNLERQSLDELKKGVKEGGRDDATFKLACYYCREGLFGDALRHEIDKLNQKHQPPLPQSDIDRIISQAIKYEAKHINRHIEEAEKIREQIDNDKPIKLTMQEIDPELHEGIPITFDCMITAVGDRKTYTKEAHMHCPECGNSGIFVCDEYFVFSPPKCIKDKCTYVYDSKKTAYIQQIMIEEFLEMSRNSAPITFNAEITNKNIGEAFMGDRKTITAKFRSIPAKDGRNIIVFEILEMKDIEQKEGCMPSDEEVQSWKNCPNFFDRVTASILPDVMIDPIIIQSVILWGVGGTGLNGKRENINEAIIGDAQQGKSELALRMHKILIGSGMTIGGKTSGAGLTIGMVKTYNGMMIPRAGFFPQYTGHNTIIDEGDKLSTQDQNSCLEVIEQGTATLTKAGIPSMKLPAKTGLLLTGNPKGGKFNSKYPTVMDNFNMEVPFISRFDLIFCMQDKNDPELDKTIRKFIRSFKSRQDQYMTLEELQRYFSYVKGKQASVPEELMDKIDELHAKMRPLNKANGLPIGWRQYHGIYRLITACAKAHLREVATEEDFEIVENIIKSALKSMKMDMDTGEVGDVVPEKITRQKVFLETLSECMDEFKTIDKEEFINTLGNKKPFNALDAQTEFSRMLKAGKFELDNDTERFKWVT